MRLSSDIKKSAILMEMASSTKEEAMEELVDLLCGAYGLGRRDEILGAIRARESRASTGVGMGLAVPHAKTEAVDRLYVALGISKQGIDFDSPDGTGARIFFVMVSAKDRTGPHIQALAGISRLIKHEEVREGILSCRTRGELLKYIAGAENKYL